MTISQILASSIKDGILELFKNQPELFDLSRLSIPDKIFLIKNNSSLFLDDFLKRGLKFHDKYKILIELRGSEIGEKVKLSESEIKKLKPHQYMKLLNGRFHEYIRADIYDELSTANKTKIFLDYPEWVINHVGVAPKVTVQTLSYLAGSSPSVIQKYYNDYSKLKTNSTFWTSMFKYNKKYIKVFLENTKSLITKSDVRYVVYNYPSVIKGLSIDIIENSKLTTKEWTLLISKMVNEHPRVFKNFKFSKEFTDYIEMDASISILKGAGSRILRSASRKVVTMVESEKNIEDTSPQTV